MGGKSYTRFCFSPRSAEVQGTSRVEYLAVFIKNELHYVQSHSVHPSVSRCPLPRLHALR